MGQSLDGRAAGITPAVVRAALRRWHDPHLGETELAARSGLVRQRVAAEGHADTPMARGQALRGVLGDAIERLGELGFADDAALLRRQFVKGDAIYTIASDLAVGERGYFKRQLKAIAALAAVLDAMEADAARDGASERAGGVKHVEPAGGEEPSPATVPFQAPPVPGWWVGRPAELAWLARRLRPGGKEGDNGAGPREARGTAATRTIAIAGLAGAGKSALAARAARRVRANFADGVIWVDAAGLDADAALVFVARALRRDERVARTASTAARAAIVRELVNRRALLIVVDGAESDEIVRLLQPSAGRSRLLVTTRRADLPSLFGAPVRMIGGLRPAESLRLLRHAAGTARVDADRRSAAALAEICGHLPLAVAVAGRLAHAHPRRSLDELGRRLGDEPLDRLRLDDRPVVRAAIEAAWESLEPRRAAFLAALGAFEGRITPDTAVFVGHGGAPTDAQGGELRDPQEDGQRDQQRDATRDAQGDRQRDAHRHAPKDDRGLAPAPLDAWEAGEWLEALADRSLLVRGHGDDYRLHALVRALARERFEPGVTLPRLCAGYSEAIALACGRLDTAEWVEALAWLDAERRTIDALVAWADDHPELPESAALLIACGGRCSPYFERRPDPVAWRRWAEAGLAAAMGVEDEAAIAACRVQLGVAAYREGRLDEAEASLREARSSFASLADPLHGAHATLCLAAIDLARGRLDDAIALSAESRAAADDLGAGALQARAENIHGLALARAGREAAAVTAFERAIAAARAVGDVFAEGFARSNVAEICGRTGRTEIAIAHARRAIEIAEAVDAPARIVRCLDTLGELQLAAGDGPSARATYRGMRGVLSGMAPRPPLECLALEIGLGRADMLGGRWRAAASRLRRARSIAVVSASTLGLAEALRHTAALWLARPAPDRERALRAALRALGLYESLGRAVGRERAWRLAVEAAGSEAAARAALDAGPHEGGD